MNTQIVHRDQIFKDIIIKSATDNSVIISGYASVYNVADLHNDVIIKGAFSSADRISTRLLWQHDWQKPIGVIKSLTEDNYGLKIEAVINNKIETGKEAIELVRQGAVDGLSIGFNIKLSNYNNLNQRVITKAELVEVSIVTFPANHHAKIAYITKQMSNLEEGNMETPDNLEMKFNLLQEKVYNLESFVSRPVIGEMQDTEYKSAFNSYIRKGNQTELIEKSFNSGVEDGGVLLVPALYNSIISEINARSPMRQLASVETISTNALDIVIEDGHFASGWVGEIEARDETASSKLKQRRIFVHELYAQPKASQALIDDAAIRIENWLIERLRDSFVKAENEAFINGDGKKRPKGILSKDHDKIEKFDMGNTLNAGKLLDFINLLSEEYLANATIIMNRATLSEIQKLKDNNGRFIWQQSLSESFKQTIFGIPVVCCSEMKPIKKGEIAMAIADFKSAYKIVDRSGISIMRDPYTEKPFVKFYAVKRVGGDVVNQKAIKLAVFS